MKRDFDLCLYVDELYHLIVQSFGKSCFYYAVAVFGAKIERCVP